MGRATKFILIALLTFTLFAAAQTASAPPPRDPGRTPPSVGALNPETIFVAHPPTQHATKTQSGAANSTPAKRELKIAGFKFQRPDPATLNVDESNLPPASSPLPLISVIGFGVLVGGIISAMKTRS